MSKFFGIVALGLLLWLANSERAAAQGENGTRGNSPYTRYGMGTLYGLNQFPVQFSAGALSNTYADGYQMNMQNPAALGSLRYTSFELGGYYQRNVMRESSNSSFGQFVGNDGNISYLSLGFPINRTWERRNAIKRDTTKRERTPIQWGMSFSLSPHSRVAYDVAVTRQLDGIGEVLYNYIGQGTRFRVNWGNGFKYKNFAIGANVGFIFGTVTERSVVDFKDSTYVFAYDEAIVRSSFARGLVFDLGAMHTFRFKGGAPVKGKAAPDYLLRIGASASLGGSLSTSSDKLTERYGTYYGRDTVLNEQEQAGTIKMPLTLGGGISFGRENRWQLGLNYAYTGWAQYSDSQRTGETLENAGLFSFGGEWTPQGENRDSYLKRITYRAGAFYGKDGRVIETANSELLPLQKYGINFGFTFPIETRVKSALSEVVILSFGAAHLGFEFGYLGHPDLIQERYFQLNVGFTINDDKWFKRTKFR